MFKDDDVNSIAAEIMAYLHRRPMASDSIDGIIYWWLAQQTIVKNKRLVAQALALLAHEGKVVKRTGSNSEAIYSLDPTQR